MNNKRNFITTILGCVSALALISASCSFMTNAASPSPSPTAAGNSQQVLPATSASSSSTETQAPSQSELNPTAAPGEAPTPAPKKAPQSPAPCQDPTCILNGNFVLQRPVGGNGRKTIDISYRYGIFKQFSQDGHHGINFLNSTGTPVVAAADGKVVVAGNDSSQNYGLALNTYGNLVIIQHSLPGVSDPVFTLYSQLSQVDVKVNDQVTAGQQIGLVGMSGSVKGSTLYFEVRMGENSYKATRNPELWLQQLNDENGQPTGALAGRILNGKGDYVALRNIVLQRLGSDSTKPVLQTIYLKTYAASSMWGQPPFQESFGAGDLPAGNYKVSIYLNGNFSQVVEVKSGKLSFVNMTVP
jgi:murein DD-endopeptidase MepM/ murein hydrolase activator NlpD